MYKIVLLSMLCLFSWSKNANAGWYQVNNYVGDIGDASVHLSLQSYSFGSGTTVEGSYYYDRYKSIIPIYGKYDDGKLKLCEISKITDEMAMISDSTIKMEKCPFTLTISENVVAGFWKKKNATYQVELKKVASFDDTGDKSIVEGIVEIPFWAQTTDHMFLGIYGSTKSGEGCLNQIKVINKISGKSDYELSFDDTECNAGLLMTPIYMNVQSYAAQGKSTITVHFADSHMGFSKDYGLNKKLNKYSYIKGSMSR